MRGAAGAGEGQKHWRGVGECDNRAGADNRMSFTAREQAGQIRRKINRPLKLQIFPFPI